MKKKQPWPDDIRPDMRVIIRGFGSGKAVIPDEHGILLSKEIINNTVVVLVDKPIDETDDRLREVPVWDIRGRRTLLPENGMKEVITNTYFKDYGDGTMFISGMQIPTDKDGVCRNIRFVDCTFHPGCSIPYENCELVNCEGTPNYNQEIDHE